MSSETVLAAALKADATLSVLVAGRIFPDEVPEGVPLPAIAYTRQGTEPLILIHTNVPRATKATIEVQCISGGDSGSRAEAEALADACIAPLAAAGFNLVDRGAASDSESKLWAAALLVDNWQ